MNNKTYDIVTVGGSLGGSALAKAMAEQGASVLVLESETQFKDRVRGESLLPWGVAECKELGIYDAIMASSGHETPWWDVYAGPERVEHRDFVATTLQKEPGMCFYHPAMQEALIQSAADAGAEVHRGSRAIGISMSDIPSVHAVINGREREVKARLIVGADGRNSMVRSWGGFDTKRERERNMIAGVLFDDMAALEDTNYIYLNPPQASVLFPQGNGRVRAYMIIPAKQDIRFSGASDVPSFIENSIGHGVPPEFYANAKPAGPLATFSGAEVQVEHPYKTGLALIGDAASQSDPCHGQGLAITMRDVRVLRDNLLGTEDWDEAGHAYAKEHNRYFNVTLTMECWTSDLLYAHGAEADALREKILPLWIEDPTRQTDFAFSGPDFEITDDIRKRFWGEDE